MQCRGFLFDLDGTLVDSLAVIERSWRLWADSYGVDPEAVLDYIHGKQAITTLRHFMPGKSEAEIQAEFLRLEQIEAGDLNGIRALPGAVELLEQRDSVGNCDFGVDSGGLCAPPRRRASAAEHLCDRRTGEAR